MPDRGGDDHTWRTAPWAVRTLEESQDPTPTLELLDALPVTVRTLPRVSEKQARGAVRRVPPGDHDDKPTHVARCRATLTTDTLPRAVAAADGDHAAMWFVPPTGFEPDGCAASWASVEARLRI